MSANEKGTVCGGANLKLNANSTSSILNPQKMLVNPRLILFLDYHAHLTRHLVPMKPASKEPHYRIIKHQRGDQNKAAGRKPSSWKAYVNDPPSADELLEWFEIDPDCNVAIITGKASGLCVVDDDGYLPFGCSIPPIPPTPGWKAVGRSYLFKGYTGRHIKRDGYELRANVLCVLPGSTHSSGVPYEWLPLRDFCEVEIADLPKNLEKLFEKPKSAKKTPVYEQVHTDNIIYVQSSPNTCPGAAPKIAADIHAAQAILAVCGCTAPAELDVAFISPLPGKPDKKPSAVLYQFKPGGTIWLHDFGGGARCGYEVTIAQVYRGHVTGDYSRIKTPFQQLAWHIRAAFDAGVLERPAVNIPPPPIGAGEAVMKVYQGLKLRAQVAAALDPGSVEFAFTRSFGMPWCNIKSEHTWQESIRQLLRGGIIHRSRQQGRLWYFKLGADKTWRPTKKARKAATKELVAAERSSNLERVNGALEHAVERLAERVKARSRPP